MPNCILWDCNNSTGKATKLSEGVTFHKFPRPGQDERELWIEFVQENREEESWLPSEHSTICSKHFCEQDFYKTPKGRRFLRKTAVPYKNPKLVSRIKTKSKNVLKKDLACRRLLHAKKEKFRQQNQILRNKNRRLRNCIKELKAKLSTEAQIDNENRLLNKVTAVEAYIRTLKKSVPCNNNKHGYYPSVGKFESPVESSDLETLSSWYRSFKANPGFTEEAFLVLGLKSSAASEENPLVCSLVFGEITICQRKLYKNNNTSSVNYGTGPQEEKATEVLVLMVVSLREDWKIPVGYFLAAGVSAEIKVKLINICLQKCNKVGVRVISLTFEGCETNYRAAEILGCKLKDPENMKTYFTHPSTVENVYIFIDPCHVLKLIRNTLENKGVFSDENDNKVRWQLLVNLNKLQHNEGLTFINNLSPRLIQFRNQVMRVKLATQLLSMNITQTLELCNDLLVTSQFLDSTGTVNFITLMNNLLDVFNSQRYHFYGYKSHLCNGNKENIFELLNKVKTYILFLRIQVKQIKTIKRPNGDPRIIMKILKKRVIDTQNLTGFDCAIICVESLKKLYCEIVEEKKIMKSISTSRLSQEHLHLFFESIRKHSGNNNPDAIQFRAAYRKNLTYYQLPSTITTYTLPLDNFSILATSSVRIINSTSPRSRYDNKQFKILQNDNKILTSDVQASINCEILVQKLNHEPSISDSKLIVGYISGYVARKLIQELKCEECVDNLLGNSKLWHHKLITILNLGGLCLSSEDVFKICVKTEDFIRPLIKQNGVQNLPTKYFNNSCIIAKTLNTFLHSDIFSSMSFHSLEQPSTFNHRLHLIRAVIDKYSIIRLQQGTDFESDLLTTMKWQKFRKLILF